MAGHAVVMDRVNAGSDRGALQKTDISAMTGVAVGVASYKTAVVRRISTGIRLGSL